MHYQALLVESVKMRRVRVPIPTFLKKAMPLLARTIIRKILVQRVAIYFILSSVAVVVINLIDFSQNTQLFFKSQVL